MTTTNGVETTEDSGSDETEVASPDDVSAVFASYATLTDRQLLVHYGRAFLEFLPGVDGDQDLEVFAATLRPAAEMLMTRLAERDVTVPEVPRITELGQHLKCLKDLETREGHLTTKEAELETRSLELAELEQRVQKHAEETNGLLDLLEESTDELFASKREELLQLQAQVRAEAAKLDELKASLLNALR